MRRLLVVAAAVLAVIAVAGIGWAAIPSSSGVISACYKTAAPDRGTLRVLDAEAGQTCPNGYAPLTWNQTGPAGPAGPSGVSGYEVVFNTAVSGASADVAVEVYCPEGKNALGGGGNVSAADPWALTYSRPITFPGNPTDPAVGWLVQAHRLGDPPPAPVGIGAWVTCASVN